MSLRLQTANPYINMRQWERLDKSRDRGMVGFGFGRINEMTRWVDKSGLILIQ